MRIAAGVLVLLQAALCASLHAATLAVTVRSATGFPVRDAVVYAVLVGSDVPPSRATAVMDQKNRTFVPHVLAVQTGTAVSFPNNDDIQHQVYSFSPTKTFQLPLYKGTPGQRIVFDKPGVVALGCNIHDNMNAFIVVVDTPYFGKTNATGRTELEGLHAGSYGVRIWHADTESEWPPKAVSLAESDHARIEFIVP